MWIFTKQDGGEAQSTEERLLQDPIVISQSFFNLQAFPQFEGLAASNEFSSLRGEQLPSVPLEDGRFQGDFIFLDVPNGEGVGSLDGHWKREIFETELMVFAIDARVERHPLSKLTIESLQDIGYTVDSNAADEFTLPLGSKGAEDVEDGELIANIAQEDASHWHFLTNDILSQFDKDEIVPLPMAPST